MATYKKGFPGGDIADQITVESTDQQRVEEIKSTLSEASGGDLSYQIATTLDATASGGSTEPMVCSLDTELGNIMVTQGARPSSELSPIGVSVVRGGRGTGLNINAEATEADGDETVVALYLAALETMHSLMKWQGHPDEFAFGTRADSPKAQRDYSRQVWALLKRSKLVSIPESMYRSLHHKWDRTICEELGYPWTPPGFGRRVPAKEGSHIMRHTKERTSRTPFPDNLPFDVVYFAYSDCVPLTQLQLAVKTSPSVSRRMQNAFLIGTLVCELGTCVDFFVGIDTESQHQEIPTIFNSFHRGPEMPGVGGHSATRGWLGHDGAGTFDLLPFILNDLVNHVNSFVDLSVSTFPRKCKENWRHNRKNLGVERREPPPHFYPYRLRSSVHTEGDTGPPKSREPLSYRTDVRAHTRLYVRRGPKPMKPARWRYYATNGFRVYIDDEPPRDLQDKMNVKGHPQKRSGEWMAVKETRIPMHMNSNDDTLPYRPKLTIA